MKKIIALACLGFAFTFSAPSVAAGEKMKGCSKEAAGMKGEARKMFMKKCLSKDYVLGSGMPATASDASTQTASSAKQDKMKSCAAEAKDKELKNADRKEFMSACMGG